MSVSGRILIADDEETFLLSTADLLRKAGYECDSAVDAGAAADLLRRQQYDLLVADIKMPGNPDLELVRGLASLAPRLPVILVTGYPSVQTAVKSHALPVMAYLLKPLDWPEFIRQVELGIKRSRLTASYAREKLRLGEWLRELSELEPVMDVSKAQELSLPVDRFLQLHYRNIVGAVADLVRLTEAMGERSTTQEICHLLNCPKLGALKGSLQETIEVLKKTKNAFKSKELGELRLRLEELAREIV